MLLQVLFHTLLTDHISVALLRDVLPGVSDYILRQHMLQMLREGFIENKLNNGKIHIHTGLFLTISKLSFLELQHGSNNVDGVFVCDESGGCEVTCN